jgi:Ran GTPase-activating protein (RanGAP) involved in mRNA processing and transport/predicted nicotinamide N-methyase
MTSVPAEYVFNRGGETVCSRTLLRISSALPVLTTSSAPQVVVHAERAAEFPEETSSRACDETGHVAWQALPILCHFILSERGQRLMRDSRVLELGAGIGVPGLLAGRVCKEVVLTDSNDMVVERLRRNVELNAADMTCAGDAVRVANVAWGAELYPRDDVLERGAFDVVLGSDVVYSATSARTFLQTAKLAMAKTRGVTALAYIPRWPAVDRALYDALRELELAAEVVPLRSFSPSGVDFSFDGHSLPRGTCLLLIRCVGDCDDDEVEEIAPPPSIVTREHVLEVTIGPEHIDDILPETCRAAGLGNERSPAGSLIVDATGPFAVTQDQVEVLSKALGASPLCGSVSKFTVRECWIGDKWPSMARGLSSCAQSLALLHANGDEIGSVAAGVVGDFTSSCPNLHTLDLSRNPFGDAGAEAFAVGFASCAALSSLTLAHCHIGDGGAAALARAFPRSLTTLNLSNNEITALGLSDIATALRLGKTPLLTHLILSGNEIGPACGAELAEALPVGTPDLEYIDLRGCSLTDPGLAWLAPSLPSCKNLTTMHLGSNGVGDVGAAALASSLAACPKLKYLGLAMNSIADGGAWDLVEELVGCKSLVSLNLKGNGLGDEGASAIADILAEVPTLEAVNLSDNDVGEEGAAALAECFEKVFTDSAGIFPWVRGLTVVLENNELSKEVRQRLETAASSVAATVKFSALVVRGTGFGR